MGGTMREVSLRSSGNYRARLLGNDSFERRKSCSTAKLESGICTSCTNKLDPLQPGRSGQVLWLLCQPAPARGGRG